MTDQAMPSKKLRSKAPLTIQIKNGNIKTIEECYQTSELSEFKTINADAFFVWEACNLIRMERKKTVRPRLVGG
jgi:hypothetical protein